MNKTQFLNKLKTSLKGLPKEEVKEIIFDYKEHFEVGVSKGKTEEQIMSGFGSPKKIAKRHKAEFYMGEVVKEKSFKNVSKALMAGFGLGLLNISIILPIFISLMAVFVSLLISGFAILLAGAAIAISPVFIFNPFPIAAVITGGIAVMILGILFMMINYYLIKWFVKVTIKYLKSTINLIKIKDVKYDEE